MKTLSVFCVGTGHTSHENWTLMKALFDLTDAWPVEFEGTNLRARWDRTTADHAKIVFDGPDALLSSNEFLRKRAAAAAEFITTHRPETICLVGHSRGAVLAVMIAEQLRHTLDPSDRNVRLWLLDLVSHTESALGGGGTSIPIEQTSTTYSNVAEVVRIVMEDDADMGEKGIKRMLSFAEFPLEPVLITGPDGNLRPDYGHLATDFGALGFDGPALPRVTLMRMPGTHGTGTQVNPIAKKGARLPTETYIRDTKPGDIWPIGEVCLINALSDLARWEVPLHPEGREFILDRDDKLLRAYSLILCRNPRVLGGGDHPPILVNDADPAKLNVTGTTVEIPKSGDVRKLMPKKYLAPYWTQDLKQVTPGRDPDQLLRYGADHRANRFIVNDQHRELLRRVYPDLVVQIEQAGRSGGKALLDGASRSAATREVVLEPLTRMRRRHNDYFGRFVMHEITVDGQPIAELVEL